MTDRLHLPLRYREQLEALLSEHVPDAEVWAYGSRVNGQSHEASDLDLVLRSQTLEPLGGEFLDLKEAIEKSNIPILVQMHDWARLPESFHREIERDYVVVQDVTNPTAAPGQWREVTLGDVCDFRSGSVFKLKHQGSPSGDYPFIKVSDMNLPANGVRIHESANWVSQAVAKKIRAKPIPEGSIVFAKIGEALKQNRLRMTIRPTIVDNNMMGAIPKTDIVESGFLFYGMHQFDFGEIASGTALPYLTMSELANLPLSLPPLPEQRAIAHVLGALDDKIELNRRMNETLEDMARALFKSWFVDFDPVRAKMDGRWRRGDSLPGLPADLYDLFPDRLVDSELGEIPEGWEVKALGELVELVYGRALRAVDRRGGSIPVYGSNGQVGWHDAKLVAGPGIVVGRKGNPGVVTWVHGDFFPIDTTFYVVSRDHNGGLPFLFFALTSQDLPSVSADSAVPGLNRNLAYMNRQILPSKQVVYAFNDYASSIFSHRRHLDEECHSLVAQRDALLPKLVSGELSVSNV